MGKKNNKYNVRNYRKIENNLSSIGTKKKTSKNVVSTMGGEFNVEEQENAIHELPMHNIRKTPKKKRKKMGRPIVVEDTTEQLSTVPLPLSYRLPEQSSVASVYRGPFNIQKKVKAEQIQKKVCIVTTECIKPNEKPDKNMQNSELIEKPETRMEVEHSTVLKNNSSSCVPLSIENSKSAQSKTSQSITDSIVPYSQKPEQRSEVEEQMNTKQLPRFYSFRNKVLVIMETDCKFSFHGKLKLRVLWGAIRVYGYSVSSESRKSTLSIYSPRAYSPVAIEAIETEMMDKGISNIWKILEEDCEDPKLAKSLQSDVKAVEEGWAVLLLENFDNSLTNFLSMNFPHHLFPRVDDPSNLSWRDSRRAEVVLQANLRFGISYDKIVIDSRGIDDVADAICYDWETKENSRTVIAGGKGVGKSTMARYLVNKLLATSESVIFLDLDLGQTEFTPAACLSITIVDEPLLGPNFTHLKIPYFQFYLGSVDVTRCLEQYVDGVKKLVELLNEDSKLSHRPIVINTMGFCKGIGADLINYILKILLPTDVIQILSKRSKNNFNDTLSRQVIDRQSLGWLTWTKDINRDRPTKHRLHVIYSEAETSTGPAESWNLEAHQQRELVMISYLSQIIKANESATSQLRSLVTSINAVTPYVVPFDALCVSIAGVYVSQILSIMNGNIVALCGVNMESLVPKNLEDNLEGSYPRVLIRPPLSTCYGFGILRGVDMEKEQLFINTPLPASLMKHVNCLMGCTNVPQSLLQLNEEGAPYTGSVYDLPTSREPRRGYVRTRYQVGT
ncbi:polynucleotide 5'-hydroxyl-kinase NOL9 [Venturia canescens]|uniref:polynucleotide 5'-hydroxyl-kinase NOL9 n=1 Tax=Venturia canescens TaxID=32260 RepID=UPI001C9D4910|nr:polynucleotide 5'-hydroxyl-kinase NOL9 [Venturia canescens]